ncbi:hypothetical protein FRC00_009680, partial [Tulasnella sp. 408]
MLTFFSPRKLPPIPTQVPIAPDAEPKLTESPEELTPPKPLEAGNYPATPSLTSSGASVASTEQQATPPNTADNARPTAAGADRARKHSPEATSPLRNSTPPPSTPNPIQRSGSAGPSTPEQQRTRPPRPPLPPVLGGDPNETQGSTQDGLSIISRTTYYTQRSAPGRYIDFAEFHALCCTSKPMRNILDVDLAVRDVILSRFVPGYRWGQAQVPMGHKDIRVDLRDLEALMLSQAIPLHIYPQHALDIVSGLPATESTGRLQHFTNVHSRFVLLLRSRAPAWSLLPDFVDDPVWRLGSTTEQWPNLRELTFPAPLSYPATAPTKEKEKRSPPSRSSSISYSKKQQCLKPIISFLSLRGSHSRRSHAPAYPVSHPRHPTGGRSDTYPVFSAHIRADGVREDGTISSTILRRSSKKPPPPPPEYTPKALKDHRRRSRISTSYSMGSSAKRTTLHRLSEAYWDDDTALFTPPRPAHLRANSLPASVSSNSEHSLALARLQGSASPTLAGGGIPGGSLPSPHELIMAATKSKAPILRIFVPSEDYSGATLLACEGQLVSAGLWRYMKPGDIVCNLGYIPAADNKSRSSAGGGEQWGWMVYNGEGLVPYEPPLPPAGLDAFELPSP